MTILGEIGLAGARETLRRHQRQPLPGDREGHNDRTVSVLAPTDETLFEFPRELDKNADWFPPDPRRRRSRPGGVPRGHGYTGGRHVDDLRVYHLVDAICDLLPGLLLSVFLD